MSKLENIRAKIASLMAKGQDEAATEAEALAAMDMAAKLMSQYGVTLDDIKNRESSSDEFSEDYWFRGTNLPAFAKLMATGVAKYTDTKVWVQNKYYRDVGYRKVIAFLGYKVDVELANYIMDVCNRAAEYEWKKYAVTLPTGMRARARRDFQLGMASRLGQRLRELKTEQTSKATGRELVVVKYQLVEREFAKKNMRLGKGTRMSYRNDSSFNAGKSAANNVSFNRAVRSGAGGGTKMIAAS